MDQQRQKTLNFDNNNPDYILKWSNSDLIIEGKEENKKLEKAFTYTKKDLVWDPRSRTRRTQFSQEKV